MRFVPITGLIAQCGMVVKASLGSCNPQIDPSAVNLTLRSQWCAGQTNTCGILCAADYDINVCDPYSLCYECTCSSNSSSPALQYYTQTMPTFQCEYTYQRCIASHLYDAAAQKNCAKTEEANCGNIHPDTFNFSTASTTYSPSDPTPNSPYRISASTLNPGIEEITSTKTITPTPTGTTTVWSTSTAGVNGDGTSGNFSTLPGVTHISGSGATSTFPGITGVGTSSASTGVLVKPSTVSTNGVEGMRGFNSIWGVAVGVVFAEGCMVGL
ncbi:hypothetical protein DSL72_005101 [Monilinia vaccinii-corymbosi]|uniref:DUF7707 domain-containing protein n=1 Tax=Monilinia vaccinii-corymbosi TaxID=61207 RepID=A0A8A3PEP9_9HELO|nr:hypothetical protein DSL72_005101 [Monilinia vaccinii-corymbosi]